MARVMWAGGDWRTSWLTAFSTVATGMYSLVRTTRLPIDCSIEGEDLSRRRSQSPSTVRWGAFRAVSPISSATALLSLSAGSRSVSPISEPSRIHAEDLEVRGDGGDHAARGSSRAAHHYRENR